MEPAVQIRLVRENLGLSIALLSAAQKGIISAGFVPNQTELESSTGERVRVLAPLEVHDTQDLVRCINNQVRCAFAFSVLQVNRCLQSVFDGHHPSSDASSEVEAARCILYLLSETVTDDLMVPIWVCPPEYRQVYEVPSASFTLDASILNGNKVYWDDFGGLPKYLDLLEFCGNQLAAQPASELRPAPKFTPKEEKEESVQQPPPAPSTEALKQNAPPDSITPFVADLCLVGTKELVLAKDLFDAYLRWCDSEGYQPLSQRTFGMKLSTLGFERRRRGKGKHWWMGVSLAESRLTVSGVAD